jgi:hypothetical protein
VILAVLAVTVAASLAKTSRDPSAVKDLPKADSPH